MHNPGKETSSERTSHPRLSRPRDRNAQGAAPGWKLQMWGLVHAHVCARTRSSLEPLSSHGQCRPGVCCSLWDLHGCSRHLTQCHFHGQLPGRHRSDGGDGGSDDKRQWPLLLWPPWEASCLKARQGPRQKHPEGAASGKTGVSGPRPVALAGAAEQEPEAEDGQTTAVLLETSGGHAGSAPFL